MSTVEDPFRPPLTACDDSPLLQAVGALSRATDISQALTFLHDFLKAHMGLRALVLEVACGPGTRRYARGDPEVLARLSQTEDPTTLPGTVVCPLDHPCAPPGEILFAFASECTPPGALLSVSTAQIAQILAQQTLLRRAEEAEEKACQRISELATIYEIGQAIDQVEPERVLQIITERTVQLMDAQACSLMLLDPETETLRVVACHGLPEEALQQEQHLGEGIAGIVARTEQPVRIAQDAPLPAHLDGVALNPAINSSMLVPLKTRDGQVLGVLSIRRSHPAPDFTEEDLQLFTVFASQAALSITNVRLYADLRCRVEELDKISTLSRSLISTLDLDELLNRIADDVCRIVRFERCCLYMRDVTRHTFVSKAKRGYPDTIGRTPFREGEGALGICAREKSPFLFDARNTPPASFPSERTYRQRKGLARSLGTDAFVAVPLLASQDRCIGMLVADNRSRRIITPAQMNLLIAYMNQAGIAIENALRYEETQNKNQQLKRLYNYTDSVLRSIENGLIATDVQGNVIQMNRAAEEALQLKAAQARGMPFEQLVTLWHIPQEEQQALSQMVRKVVATGVPIHEPKFLLHPDATRQMWLNLTFSPQLDHNEELTGVVVVFDDVTQEVRLEMELEKMRRLADIGQLAAKMAHEVRNALSPIRGAAQMLQADLEAQHASTEWTHIIMTEVDNLSRLTNEMLNFARQAPLNLQSLELTEFLTTAVQSMANFLLEHRVIIQWELAPDLPDITADPAQLSQVVRNLVMNAAQAMPDGGELRIRAEYLTASRQIVLSFHDNGVGIAPEDREHIFRPFVTTKSGGTGLGLPIVQRIVDQHGGRVEVESATGQGACFRVFLPLCPPGESPPLPGHRFSPAPPAPLPDQ
ncbi:MAG: GAF domain-containing protein [Chloroherpetonaceae bacterium]|nr:GAF domain-containing protein [Chthonomonadaceae bacterium]MDW8208315.1 GAF domain-containing protein [Chloroherpetonaceae bacterium]